MGNIVNCSPQDCYKNFGNKEGTLRNSELINKKCKKRKQFFSKKEKK